MRFTFNQLRWVTLILRAVGSVLFVGTFFTPPTLHPWMPLMLSACFFGFSAHWDYRRYRCPHCGYHLGKRMFPLPEACVHCGNPIHLDDEACDPTKKSPTAMQ
ncbi:MAG: hypothetical protein PUJ57_05155 [Peptoniphilaceae bacterium]|nr:hypothetical protein [Peptoniphilaceae bacterium]MDY6085531.1 hypothetical protein [Peptoniphilaceae bacterium]